MRRLRSTPSAKIRRNLSRIAFAAGIALILPNFILAEGQPKETEQRQAGSGEQTQIDADKLITNDAQGYADFIGAVRTSYKDFVIVSDRLRIYYRDNLPGLNSQPDRQELIKRIVASGNVTITSDKYTAETDTAEYDMDTQILVLDGENSMIQSGKNVLTGSKITVYRKDEKIEAEGGPQKRVKAVFYSNKQAESSEDKKP
jgi:lipopolysaccharide export system protein LptA